VSKTISATINCPNCQNQFNFTLYRSIWGEVPENRDLVMSDKINIAICPSCEKATKLVTSLFYTNADQHFAVWWEPEYDSQIDTDCQGYGKMMGPGNYLAAAPRIKVWKEFKNTIVKFENGELKGKAGTLSKDMQGHLKGFVEHIENQTQKKSGCLGALAMILIPGPTLVYSLIRFFA